MSGEIYERYNQRRKRNPEQRYKPEHGAARDQRPASRQIYAVTVGDPATFDIRRIANVDNLIQVWWERRQYGGQAHGVDGMTYNLSYGEMMKVLRNTEKAILEQRYFPNKMRYVSIEKPNGGYRRLGIPTVIDRVVGRAVAEALRPVLAPALPRMFGPTAGCQAILEAVKQNIEQRGWYWIAVDDIRNCYPSIPTTLADQTFNSMYSTWHVPETERQGIPWLVSRLVTGSNQQNNTTLQQGGTLTPITAEIVLSNILDSQLETTSQDTTILHRYVDDIHIQGPDRTSANDAMTEAQRLLNSHGLHLKNGGRMVKDIRHDSLTILGIEMKWTNGRICFSVPNRKWTELQEGLTIDNGGSLNQTQSKIIGFINAYRLTMVGQQNRSVSQVFNCVRKAGICQFSKTTIAAWVDRSCAKGTSRTENQPERQNETIPLWEYGTSGTGTNEGTPF